MKDKKIIFHAFLQLFDAHTVEIHKDMMNVSFPMRQKVKFSLCYWEKHCALLKMSLINFSECIYKSVLQYNNS